MIGKRIEKIRKFKRLSRRKLQELTGIPDYTWQAVEIGKQSINEEHIKALTKIWPEFKHWIIFGETIEEAGQISPEIEEQRQKLQNKAG